MDHPQDIESTLNALLLNAKELQEACNDSITDRELFDAQEGLLNHLFTQWNRLSEEEKKEICAANLETKIFELSRTNQACLRRGMLRS